MALLVYLARAAGVVGKEELIRHVWHGRAVGDDTIASTVSRLRSAFGPDGRTLLKTVSKKGYVLAATSPIGALPKSDDAKDLCRRGLAALQVDTRDSRRQARLYFEAALEREADAVPALAGLACVWLSTMFAGAAKARDVLPKASAAAARAVGLDGQSTHGWAALAFATFLETRDGARAGQEFGNALSNGEADPIAYRWSAFVCVARRRFEEAERLARTAVAADPHLLSARATLVQVLLCARKFEAARAEALATLNRAPGEGAIWQWLGWCELFMKRQDAAAAAFGRSFRGEGAAATALRSANLGAFFAQLAQDAANTEERTPFRPVDRAIVCAYGGEGDRAMRLLRYAARANDAQLAWVAVLPQFDRLRGRKDFEQFRRDYRAS